MTVGRSHILVFITLVARTIVVGIHSKFAQQLLAEQSFDTVAHYSSLGGSGVVGGDTSLAHPFGNLPYKKD